MNPIHVGPLEPWRTAIVPAASLPTYIHRVERSVKHGRPFDRPPPQTLAAGLRGGPCCEACIFGCFRGFRAWGGHPALSDSRKPDIPDLQPGPCDCPIPTPFLRRLAAPPTCTVRLPFPEPSDTKPGGRVFNVVPQRKIVCHDLGVRKAGDLQGKFKGSGPLRARKGSLQEGGIRVPMIARWPGRIAPGTVSRHISCFHDMMPTFAELAGAALEKPTDGISMTPTLLGRGEQKQHPYLYWELKNARAVRLGRFKAVRAKAGIQLFDLDNDLAESTDVAAKQPDVVKRIHAILEQAHTDSAFATWTYQGPLPAGTAKPPRKRKARKS